MIINTQYRDAARTAELLFKEIVLGDDYRLRALAFSGAEPATIYDIGANIGMFALQARMLFPRAAIVCLEPCPETFAALRQNTEHLRVWTKQAALARSGPVYLVRDRWSDGSNRVEPIGGGVAIEALTLAQIVPVTAGAYALKLDCEGGEGSIIGDPASERALAGALHWALEYHPPYYGGVPGREFLRELTRIDPRATGQPTTDGRWLMWSKLP